MSWVKLDDGFHGHEKIASIEPDLMLAAVGLHALTLSWCGAQLTDGRVPKAQVVRLAGSDVQHLVDELVRVRLWHKRGENYEIHDYLDYNPPSGRVKAEREAAKARMKNLRDSRRSSERMEHHVQTCSEIVQSPRPVPVPLPQKKEQTLVQTAPKNGAPPNGFDEWWKMWPKKVDKGHAVRAYKAALLKVPADVILRGLESQVNALRARDVKFIPLPATWLNGERWADESEVTVVTERAKVVANLRAMLADGREKIMVRGICEAYEERGDHANLWEEVSNA